MLVKRAMFAGFAGLLSLTCAACTTAPTATTSAAPMQPAAIETATETITVEMTDKPRAAEPTATAEETEVVAESTGVSSAVVVASNQPLATSTETVTVTTGADGAQAETAAGAASMEGGPDLAVETTTPASAAGEAPSFADADLGFQLSHPASFLVTPITAAQLAQLTPAPLAGYRIMNPEMAASDIAELEPADLEIRVYAATDLPLPEWLAVGGLLPADGSVTPVPFAAANVQGLEVCASTMIAPGCAYFFAGSARPATIYQLIPATLEGEEMLRSFAIDG